MMPPHSRTGIFQDATAASRLIAAQIPDSVRTPKIIGIGVRRMRAIRPMLNRIVRRRMAEKKIVLGMLATEN